MKSIVISVGTVTLGILLLSTARGADVEERFRQVDSRCWEQLDAGNLREAERLAIELNRMAKGPLADNPWYVAAALNTLGLLYRTQGRYSEAEPLLKQALAMREKIGFSPNIAGSLTNLAHLYKNQGRYAEADPLLRRALAISDNSTSTSEQVDVAQALSNLAESYRSQGLYSQAEPLYERALAICEKDVTLEYPTAAGLLTNTAALYAEQRRYAEAERLGRRALAIYERACGPEHPYVALNLNNLAVVYRDQARYAEAEKLADRAIELYGRSGVGEVDRIRSYTVRADIHWAQGRRKAAVGDLRQAMDLAQQSRTKASGAERERATAFAQYTFVFEKMMECQTVLGDLYASLDALERSRARTLLDRIETHGRDLLIGLPEEEANTLRRNEAQAQSRLAGLQKQWQVLDGRTDISPERKRQDAERFPAEVRRAQSECASAYAAICNASPAYRLAVGKDLRPATLDAIQPWVDKQGALLLEYLTGSEGGYVLIVPAGGKARLEKLELNETQAKVLGVDVGPLTNDRLSAALEHELHTGLVDQLRKAETAEAVQRVAPGLAVFWDVLIPERERQAILHGKYTRLIVLPDGPMTKLPFETLVVQAGARPRYLLDVGPAIEYAPSATVLMNLVERKEPSGVNDREPVLTLGDCQYGKLPPLGEKDLLAQLGPRARYGSLGGRLNPLPYSAMEVLWVSQVFGARGTEVAWLTNDLATEANVRFNVRGRRILHFACHGLVDQHYGNVFGALALTPGPNPEDPNDDGFLTLAEIYGLNLKSCELTILSACDTNVGPVQRGEGIWALSRGFLVAGSRRVVASNWLVDDEAAASLVSYFCAGIAQAEKEGKKPDYVKGLHGAKCWVRAQEKWQSPYYWGGLVLVGPN